MAKNIKPPKFAVENAKKAQKCIKKGSKAMTQTGRDRMNQLANREKLSKEDLKSISQFERHKSNAKFSGKKCNDKGAVAWLGWGNGFSNGKPNARMSNWAERKLDSMKK